MDRMAFRYLFRPRSVRYALYRVSTQSVETLTAVEVYNITEDVADTGVILKYCIEV